jgi:hypothetical protein
VLVLRARRILALIIERNIRNLVTQEERKMVTLKEELKEAKINLYRLILCKQSPNESEINIGYELSKDKDIQEVLDKVQEVH